ncbi:MAG: class I SAM-dependent methyltransferase [Planctomycetota bacterium]|nr:class I SAM-dependent methyltransferase [Planctomycetota bacterium]
MNSTQPKVSPKPNGNGTACNKSDHEASAANPLLDYFEKNDKRLIHKWMHYFDIYHRHFAAYRNQQPRILEFGVSHGGSLQMWKEYFGPGAKIHGVDLNPQCQDLEEDDIRIFIGDQEDRGFLRELAETIGPVDILIDDGGHTMNQQIATFEELYPLVAMPGVYLAEDLHTSYWKGFGGGVRKKASFIEYSKRLIDQLNAWHVYRRPTGFSLGDRIEVDALTRSAYSMSYYDSVFVIEKAEIAEPAHRTTGNKSFD